MTNFQIGAQMYSVRNHCQDAGEMLTCLKVLKTMGYNCCHLSGHSRDISAEQLRDMQLLGVCEAMRKASK